MYLLLIAACVTADPIPANIREYFQRADEGRARHSKDFEKRLQRLRNDEANPEFKGTPRAMERLQGIQLAIRQTQAGIDNLNKTKPRYFFPSTDRVPTKLDTIGLLRIGTVETIIDKQTAVIALQDQTAKVILTNIDTTEMKTRTQFVSTTQWQVVPTTITDDQILRAIGASYSVKPLTHEEIEKHRPDYEAARTQPTP